MRKALYIINPAGHGGSGMRTWEKFKAHWRDPIADEDVRVTERPGHARDIAATATGYDTLVAVGGDGTVGEVISGVMDDEQTGPCVAIVPGGTGNDIARNLGMGTVDAAVAALRDGVPQSVDIVDVECQVDGQPEHRFAFLYGSTGFSSLPLVKPWIKRWLGAAIAYNEATLRNILTFQAPVMKVRSVERCFDGRSWMVIAGNAERTSGGSVCMSPGARTDDGLLDVAIYPNRNRFLMLTQLFPKIPSGAQVDEADVAYFRTASVAVDSDPPSIVELDGDLFGTTPATFTVVPDAVKVLCRR
jgi:YegS/Rv2252/BmrU family lipid kinase